MENLIEQLVAAAVAKVPADIRQVEADSLRAGMTKALAMLGATDPGWNERVLRKMAAQYTTWQGQNAQNGQKAGKR
jgi:hypothetical protein